MSFYLLRNMLCSRRVLRGATRWLIAFAGHMKRNRIFLGMFFERSESVTVEVSLRMSFA